MKFEDVMTAAEAAERWKISPVTVKQACSGQRNTPPRFTSEECRKAKGTWLVTKQGMERVYGTMKIRMTVKDLYKYICEHNNISDVVDISDLQEDGYKRLRRALDWNNIPVLPPEGHISGWDDQVATFRSELEFDKFMEIWNPSEKYKESVKTELFGLN
jgi:hypothetical protein